MFRLRPRLSGLHKTGLTLLALPLLFLACVDDVDLDPEDRDIDVDAVTRSVFDATNPVGVLQRIPAPTALAQVDPADADGDGLFGAVDFESTAPEPCEGRTTASCLPLASQGGWPTSGLNPELFFSSPIIASTASAGISLLEVLPNGGVAPLAFSIQQSTLDAPPGACLGGVPESSIDDYTSTVRVEIVPDAGFQPDTRYLLFANAALRGEPRLDAEGNPGDPRIVEPSALFFLLVQNGAAPIQFTPNSPDYDPAVDGPPSTENGTFLITGPLEAQVAGSVRAAVGPDAPDEVYQAAIQSSGESLFGLQTFFRGLAATAEQLGIAAEDLVFANAWSTGSASRDDFPKVVFAPDPTGANQQLPFPNVPLLTTATVAADGSRDVVNAIPAPAGGSPLVGAIFDGLNTLNGFGTTTPIALSTTAPIDEGTAAGNVLLVPYDPETNAAAGTPVPVQVEGAADATGRDVNGRDIYSLTVQPLQPLLPDTFYALGITSGLQDVDGRPFIQDDNFLPLSQTSTDSIAQIVACGGIDPETGEFPSDAEIAATLTSIETTLARARWQPGFEVFENLTPAVPRTNLAIAVPYKTQDITATVDVVSSQLLPAVYPMLPDPSGLPEVQPVPGLQFEGPAARGFVCSTLCSQGVFALPVPGATPILPSQCTDGTGNPTNDVLTHPLCDLTASDISEVRLLDVKHYTLTAGNPQVAGTFTEQTVGQPFVDRMQVWYVAGGPAPAGGRPIAIFQHGLTRQKEDVLLLANRFAGINDEGGWALLAPDLPFHGTRTSDLRNGTDGDFCNFVDPQAVTCNQSGECIGGCDGQRDPSSTGFLGLNLFANRDNIRQAVVDHLTLLDHIRQGRIGAAVSGAIDTDRVSYFGYSMGAIVGGVTMAYTPDLESTVLTAGGGPLTRILLDSSPLVTEPLLGGLAAAGVCTPVDPEDITQGCEDTPEFNQFVLLAQTALDPADPLANSVGFVEGVLPGRPSLGTDVLLKQIIAPDKVVPNASSFNLAAAYGFIDPATGMPTTDQFQAYDTSSAPGSAGPNGCHGLLLAPLDTSNPAFGFCGDDFVDAICKTFGMQNQAAAWIDSAGMTVADQQLPNVGGLLSCE